MLSFVPVSSTSKTPFFTLLFLAGPDQVPEGQQDFQMKSPVANLYGEASLQPEPLFLSTYGAPAGSAAGLEVDDREDISEEELVTGSNTELPLDQDNIQSENQSYRETSAASSSDNPWAGSRPQPVGKVSVAFPAEEWLCKKFVI